MFRLSLLLSLVVSTFLVAAPIPPERNVKAKWEPAPTMIAWAEACIREPKLAPVAYVWVDGFWWSKPVVNGYATQYQRRFKCEPVEELRKAILWVCERDQILHSRELEWSMQSEVTFNSDLENIHTYYEFVKDCPRVEEADFFRIDMVQVQKAVVFNMDFSRNMEKRGRYELDRADFFATVVDETEQLGKAWRCLLVAKCPSYMSIYRRQSLRDLKNLIGEEDYKAGRMPDYVPIHRFNSN